MPQTLKGPVLNDNFEELYESFYGERWLELREAMLGPKKKVSLLSPFENSSTPEAMNIQWANQGLNLSFSESEDPSYQLDLASLIPVLALEPQAGDSVLDMCAAPGGKSLALIYLSRGESDYQINEHSLARAKRLRANLKEFLPEDLFSKVQISKVDASRMGLRHKDTFDRILLDAPCSGERYILSNQRDYNSWKPSRTKFLSGRQFSLLCAASDALKPEGRLVYSTCSISESENDAVIRKILKRREMMRIQDWEPPQVSPLKIEKTEFGFSILPDQSEGFGPIYFSILTKESL